MTIVNLYMRWFAGNDDLFWLTAANDMKRYELRIDLHDFYGNSRYAKYSEFKIASERLNYKMAALGPYTGNAGRAYSYTTYCVHDTTFYHEISEDFLIRNFVLEQGTLR